MSHGNIINKSDHVGTALDVHVADSHFKIINRYFAQFTGTTSSIDSAVSSGDTFVTVASDAAFSVGNFVDITEGNLEESNFAVITAKPGSNVLTLDRPLDNDYTIAGSVEKVVVDVSTANGSLGTPIFFEVKPPANGIWHLTRLLVTITDLPQPADNLFHNLSALSHGIVFRENKEQNRILTNWKRNADMIGDSFDVQYAQKGGGGSDWGVRVRWTFKNADSISRLSGFNGEKIEMIVQDNLTALNNMEVKLQGHLEE